VYTVVVVPEDTIGTPKSDLERRTSHQALVEIPDLKSNAPAPVRDAVLAALSDNRGRRERAHLS
jgi:vacuolar-type H+-ATPase subunit F/Vma7